MKWRLFLFSEKSYITYLLDLIREKGLPFRSIILAQDAAMQYRMEAGLRKYVTDTLIVGFFRGFFVQSGLENVEK